MELFQLKYFLTVAQFEHVTKAAESLHVAQPAVSQAIRHLEEELDVSLFDRENHHIALNSNGKYLQNRLLPIMSALDSLPEDLKEASRDPHEPALRFCDHHELHHRIPCDPPGDSF